MALKVTQKCLNKLFHFWSSQTVGNEHLELTGAVFWTYLKLRGVMGIWTRSEREVPPPSSHTAVRLFKISFLYCVKVTSLRQQLSALGGKRPILYFRGGRRAPKTKRREERLWLDSHGTTWPTSSIQSQNQEVFCHTAFVYFWVS